MHVKMDLSLIYLRKIMNTLKVAEDPNLMELFDQNKLQGAECAEGAEGVGAEGVEDVDVDQDVGDLTFIDKYREKKKNDFYRMMVERDYDRHNIIILAVMMEPLIVIGSKTGKLVYYCIVNSFKVRSVK